MVRRAYVGGNWKMNLHLDEAEGLAAALIESMQDLGEGGGEGGAEVVVFPALPYLLPVGRRLREAGLAGSWLKLGAQDFYHEPNGAYTGEVSLSMLRDVGASVVLVGHSERRHVLGESDPLINQKVLAAVGESDVEVILCIGETLEQREAEQTDAINRGQLALGLAGVRVEQLRRVTIAYEPVWAIGTGRTATPGDAQSAHAAIRAWVRFTYGDEAAEGIRIQYGGSVKPDNAASLIEQADVDGFLVGGASLKAGDFSQIVKAAGGHGD